MAGLKKATLLLLLLISQVLAINVILYAKAPNMANGATKEWTIPPHTCNKPEQKILKQMGAWSKNKFTAQMAKDAVNPRVVITPKINPDSEAAALNLLREMEIILNNNTKKGWCEKALDKLRNAKKRETKRMVGNRRGTRYRRTYRI